MAAQETAGTPNIEIAGGDCTFQLQYAGGSGERSARIYSYANSGYECIGDDEACRSPDGQTGAPGCINNTAGTDPQSCQRFPPAQVKSIAGLSKTGSGRHSKIIAYVMHAARVIFL